MGAGAGRAMRGVLPALAWAAGLALQLQQAQLPAPAANAALLGAGLLAAVLAWFWRRRLPGLLLGLCAAALLAFASTNWRAQRQLDQQLAPALDGQDVLVTGVVAEMPRSVPEGQRFVLEVESASQRGRAVTLPPRLSLGWYREPFDDAALTGAIEPMRAGQRWVLPLRVRAVHGTFNPHGFDLELWAFERELGGGGYVRAKGEAAPRKLVEDTGAHPVERLRQQVRDAISTRVADADAAGVLAALAIGDQAAIARDGWDLFRVTGVAHLMSISGLHVTMFAWLAGGLVGALWRRHPRAPLWCPAPLAARWGGLLAATAYALLAGWGVPAQRTLGMIAVVALLRSGGLRWPLHCVLLAAGSVVLLGDPWAMLQPGFWLSFVAVALLVAAEPVRVTDGVAPQGRGARLRATLQGALRTQAVATVGLAPLSLVFFQQLSLVGFVANLLAIPLVTLLITPLALLGMLLPPLWALAAGLVQGLSAFLQLLAAWPLAQWTAAAAPPWAICCGLLGGALAVMPLPWRLRVLALPLVLPLLWPPLQRPAEGQFELVAADVGQGTAVLLRTRSHLLLYDTGPQYSPEADAGGRVLLPLLRGRGEQRVDLLMLSHRDSDHVGGAATVLAGAQVVRISSSLADDHLLHAAAPPHGRCEAGQRWQWDGVQFAVLHPQAQAYGSGAKSNAMSCVLHVQGQGRSVLLTGDIEAPQEAALLARDAAALRADVLLVPHHGSRTSSTAAFIAAVQPRVAVVQAAWRSRFGHPAPDVVARYLDSGVTVVRTDRCGAWALSATGFASCERQRRPRYWHHHLEAQTEP